MTTFTDTTSEGVGVALASPSAVATPLTETVRNVDEAFPTRAVTPVATDLIATQASLGNARTVVMALALALAQSEAIGWTLHESLTDTSSIAASLIASWVAQASDTIGVAEALTIVRGAVIAEQLGLAPSQLATGAYGRSWSDSAALTDSLLRFLGGTASDTLGIAPILAGSNTTSPSLSDGIGVALSATPQLIVRVTAADIVEIDDVDVLQLLFAPTLADGIQISAGYLAPGDDFTTWAINTRTGAVTEYDNFAFNSFASMGAKYLGARSDGLYELNGDSDAGTAIIARIKSGFAQFAGTRMTQFKGIYLGVRGDGDWVFRLETGEGLTYDYAVATRDQRTTKVHHGKGLRARYFAFELISTGQDFDLDTIEFVPLIADRRV